MHAVRVGRSLELPDTALPQFMHHRGFFIWQSHGLTRLLGQHKRWNLGRSVLRSVAPEYAQRTEAVIQRPPLLSHLRVELLRADGVRVPVVLVGMNAVVRGLVVRMVEVRVVL